MLGSRAGIRSPRKGQWAFQVLHVFFSRFPHCIACLFLSSALSLVLSFFSSLCLCLLFTSLLGKWNETRPFGIVIPMFPPFFDHTVPFALMPFSPCFSFLSFCFLFFLCCFCPGWSFLVFFLLRFLLLASDAFFPRTFTPPSLSSPHPLIRALCRIHRRLTTF